MLFCVSDIDDVFGCIRFTTSGRAYLYLGDRLSMPSCKNFIDIDNVDILTDALLGISKGVVSGECLPVYCSVSEKEKTIKFSSEESHCNRVVQLLTVPKPVGDNATLLPNKGCVVLCVGDDKELNAINVLIESPKNESTPLVCVSTKSCCTSGVH